MQFVNIHTHHPTGRHIEPSGAGIHPWEAGSKGADGLADAIAQADAAGETGLDFICSVPRERQEEIFREHLRIAAELDKPVILHCVRAFEPMMKILAEFPLRAVIFHGFTGSPQQAERAVRRGYYLSFGHRTFKSPKTVEALKLTPLQNLFLETDDADISIEEIYRRAAEVKGLTTGELQAATLKNYRLVFERQ